MGLSPIKTIPNLVDNTRSLGVSLKVRILVHSQSYETRIFWAEAWESG